MAAEQAKPVKTCIFMQKIRAGKQYAYTYAIATHKAESLPNWQVSILTALSVLIMINRPQLMKHQATLKSDGASEKLKGKTVLQEESQILSFQPNFKPNPENNPALKDVKPSKKPDNKSKRHLSAYIQSVNKEKSDPQSQSKASKQGNTKQSNNQTSNQPSSQNYKHSQFLMGLNNRIAKTEAKLDSLDLKLEQSLTQKIGYKELGLTLALSLLIFTSLGLVFTSAPNQKSSGLEFLDQLSNLSTEKLQNLSQSLSSALQPNNSKQQDWLINTTDSISNTKYKWPLERKPKNKQLNYNTFKHGINLKAKLGDPVVAIDSGVVIFSDNSIADYGNLILIQHDNDIISVYGNNYSNYVKKGQTIRKGELIAAVGETHGNQPRLYFELRYKGKAQDPFLYYQ